MTPIEAYCVKCKANRRMRDVKRVTMKNGRAAARGVCAECGTGMYKILPAAIADEMAAESAPSVA